jgi:uncharacterized protein
VSLPVLGVGLSYAAGVAPIAQAGLVDFVEIEPQTLWYQAGPDAAAYRVDRQVVDHLLALPCPKLLHSVGSPAGGTRPPQAASTGLVAEMAAALGSPWVSEHLSFNRAGGADGEFTTGFLLPPRQTPQGVDAAVASITAMAARLPVPLAVETGVNYLRPRSDELPDGQFVAAVVEGADCGLLLDLHNLWTNERNGRQPIREFLDQIPLERVWEVHLAGGTEREGYWLDAHCGGVPEPLLELTRGVLPRLPQLRALVFELFPAFLPTFGLTGVREQLGRLRELWAGRGRAPAVVQAGPAARSVAPVDSEAISPAAWEDTLGGLAVGRDVRGRLARQLREDPGLAVVQDLIGEFRASMLAATMRRTIRLLLLTLGEEPLRRLLASHWRQCPPQLFASAEAERFADHLTRLGLDIPFLGEIVAFERAILATLLDGRSRVARFGYDPMPVLRALDAGRLPEPPTPGLFEIELTHDQASRGEPAAGAAARLPSWHH